MLSNRGKIETEKGEKKAISEKYHGDQPRVATPGETSRKRPRKRQISLKGPNRRTIGKGPEEAGAKYKTKSAIWRKTRRRKRTHNPRDHDQGKKPGGD